MTAQAAMTLSERADHLEEHMAQELERIVTKSVLFNLADGKVEMESGPALQKKYPGKYNSFSACSSAWRVKRVARAVASSPRRELNVSFTAEASYPLCTMQ